MIRVFYNIKQRGVVFLFCFAYHLRCGNNIFNLRTDFVPLSFLRGYFPVIDSVNIK